MQTVPNPRATVPNPRADVVAFVQKLLQERRQPVKLLDLYECCDKYFCGRLAKECIVKEVRAMSLTGRIEIVRGVVKSSLPEPVAV